MAASTANLTALQSKAPGLAIYAPTDADFDKLAALYIKGTPSRPLAIVRPTTEAEVSATVAFAHEESIPLAVRAGGHDFYGRSGPDGALVIDLRDMSGVEIVDDGRAAIIGGGILAQDLADRLALTGHTTTFGASSTVGWAGWAMHGGYGPFEGVFGLGVDQIVGARVVDYRGCAVDADDELLYGIRGAGSAFGVVTSLKIRIYQLEKVFAGVLIFFIGAVETMLDSFLERYQAFLDSDLPRELGLDLGVINVPNTGKALFCSFLWASSDVAAGQAALDRLTAALGPTLMNTVAEMTPPAWLRAQNDATPPYGVFAPGGPANFMVGGFDDPAVRAVLVKYTAALPPANPAALWVEHHVHGAALENATATAARSNSSFAYRKQHIMVEVVGTAVVEDLAQAAGHWATTFDGEARALLQVFPGGYIVLIPPGVAPKLCYPDGHWDRLTALKRRVDPGNLFAFSVTGLDGKS